MKFFSDDRHEWCETEPCEKAKEKSNPSDMKRLHLNTAKVQDVEFF